MEPDIERRVNSEWHIQTGCEAAGDINGYKTYIEWDMKHVQAMNQSSISKAPAQVIKLSLTETGTSC